MKKIGLLQIGYILLAFQLNSMEAPKQSLFEYFGIAQMEKLPPKIKSMVGAYAQPQEFFLSKQITPDCPKNLYIRSLHFNKKSNSLLAADSSLCGLYDESGQLKEKFGSVYFKTGKIVTINLRKPIDIISACFSDDEKTMACVDASGLGYIWKFSDVTYVARPDSYKGSIPWRFLGKASAGQPGHIVEDQYFSNIRGNLLNFSGDYLLIKSANGTYVLYSKPNNNIINFPENSLVSFQKNRKLNHCK
jgi:hypothetical protein